MNENMEQRRKVRQINVAREVLEGFGYEVIDPDEKEEGPEAPNGPTVSQEDLLANIERPYSLSEVANVLKELITNLVNPDTAPLIDTVATLRGLLDRVDV